MATLRLPLTYPVEFRDSSTDKGSKMVNCFFEKDYETTYAKKRPGYAASGIELGAGQGQGIFGYGSKLIAVKNNTVYDIVGTTGTSIGTLTGNTDPLYFINTLGNTYVFFHKTDSAYTLSGTTVTQVKSDWVAFVTLQTGGSGYSSSPTVTFSAPPSGVTATGTATVSGGVITGINITNPGSGYVTAPSITITDSTGVNATAICNLNSFPTGQTIVPGTVYLDGYTFVMTRDAKIWNSQINDPTRWWALDYITAEAEPDLGVGIAKHFNYLVAFGEWSTEFFYDAGTTTGSPLLPNQAMRIEFGCANGDSIVSMQETVVWVAQAKNVGRSVLMLENTRPVQISDPSVERILNASNLSTVRSYSIQISGHYFYVLSLIDEGYTLVCDVKTKQWCIWTSLVNNQETYVEGTYYTAFGNEHYTLDNLDGKVYNIREDAYSDESGPIQLRIRSSLIDFDSTKRKFISRLEIVGDKVDSIMRIRHTDDDYQNWSPYRNVNLGDTRSVLYQNGSFRRRAYEFFHTDDVPLRLRFCEIDAEPGLV